MAVLIASSTVGCNAFTTIVYLIHGTEVDPECDIKLEGRIAVLCWTNPSTVYDDGDNASALGESISRQLGAKLKNKKKITMVSQQEVNNRMDNYPDNISDMDDLIAIAKELDVDYLVGVYLVGFEHLEATNVFRGRANVEVHLIDGKQGTEVYSKIGMPQYVYPPNRSVTIDSMSAFDFKRLYIEKLGNEVGKLFYKHDRHDMDI